MTWQRVISIHPPREGWDAVSRQRFRDDFVFQSTHPVRGGTVPGLMVCATYCISIHPPREGWDHRQRHICDMDGISIHPPREGWDISCFLLPGTFVRFQSTHPVRGGTVALHVFHHCFLISIHPPREGWDYLLLPFSLALSIFQSTHPVRGGTVYHLICNVTPHYFNPPTP